MTPLAPDRTRAIHSMLVPKDATADHYDKSFALIDEGVFAAEDFKVVEAMQRGLESGANETLLFGELEHASLWFHASIQRHVSGR